MDSKVDADGVTTAGLTTAGAVCESCGAPNAADASFCHACRAFIGWDRTAVIPAVPGPATGRRESGAQAPLRPAARVGWPEENVETRVIPKVIEPETGGRPVTAVAAAAPAGERSVSVLAVRLDADQVIVPTDGQRTELVLLITNRSDIVDGYEVDAGGVPPWLRIDSQPLRLLPGSEDRLVMGFRIAAEGLVPAGRVTVRLRVRSQSHAAAHQIISVVVIVPVVDAPVRLRAEPSVVRLPDVEVGRFVAVIDNSAANRPAHLRLSGTDPELAVSFHFDPPVVTVEPGEVVRVRVVTTSPRPRPGSELSRMVTITASEGQRRVDTTATLVQSSSAVVEDPMVGVTAAPSLLRLRDRDDAQVHVGVDNRAGRHPVTVRLEASDPERVMQVSWSRPAVTVPAGRLLEVELCLAGPPPEPGTEVTRTVTIAAWDGRRVARTELTVVHAATPSPMSTLAVQLDPSVLRLGSGRHGRAVVLVDNRAGRMPARVRLSGDDPENVVTFGFSPAELTVEAGQVARSQVRVSAPRPPGGRELTRPLSVSASDGRTVVSTAGSLLQAAADRRPWARLVLTLLGAVAMFVGTMLPLRAVSSRVAFQVDATTVAALFGRTVDWAGFEVLVTLGLVISVLAGLMLFGLTGRSGRLTRFAALIAVLGAVALLITFGISGRAAMPGTGTIAIILGGVLGYAAGLLARR